MTHCEDTNIINHNMAEVKAKYGNDPAISLHPTIRSEEACYNSSSLAVNLAKTYGTRLHIAHLSTAKELSLIPVNDHAFDEGPFPQITGEAVLSHLLFTNDDYATRKALIKCNPAVKTAQDRDALRGHSRRERLLASERTMLHTSSATSKEGVRKPLRECPCFSSLLSPCCDSLMKEFLVLSSWSG